MSKGGKRKGAGRKPSGRILYRTRLPEDRIAWIKEQAILAMVDDCDILGDAVDYFALTHDKTFHKINPAKAVSPSPSVGQ